MVVVARSFYLKQQASWLPIMDLEVNLLQILVDQLPYYYGVLLCKRRLVLRLILACSRFPPLWIDNVAVFTCSLLYKVLIGNDILLFYDIHITRTKVLDKLSNLLVIMNFPEM